MSPLVKNPSFGDTSCFCLFYFIFAFYRLLQNCLQNFLSPILSFSIKSTLVKVISEFQMFNSVVNFQFLFNLLAAFIRVVHFLLPEKNFSFGLQNASLSCFSSTYSSPRYNVWPLCLALFRCHVFFSNIYLFSYVACGILVPSPGMEPVQSLKHWVSREVPQFVYFQDSSTSWLYSSAFFFFMAEYGISIWYVAYLQSIVSIYHHLFIH